MLLEQEYGTHGPFEKGVDHAAPDTQRASARSIAQTFET